MMIHVFYFKEPNDIPNRIYAYTDNDDYAKAFKEQRNMRKFVYKKLAVSKSEFKEIKQTYPKQQLTYGRFYTVNDEFGNQSFGNRLPANVLCTWIEEESIVINSDRLWEEASRFLFDSSLLKSKYLKSLEKLLFMQFYLFYGKNGISDRRNYFYEPYYSGYGPVEDLILEDMQMRFSYDELALFLKYYGHTFDVKTQDD